MAKDAQGQAKKPNAVKDQANKQQGHAQGQAKKPVLRKLAKFKGAK